MNTNTQALREAIIKHVETAIQEHCRGSDLYMSALRAAEKIEALSNPPAPEQASGEPQLFPNGIAHLIPPITMSVGQLRYAVLGMGGDDNETLLTFQYRQACKDMDGEDAPAGMVCWLHEYPEEGSLHLPQDIDPPWPATTTAEPAGEAVSNLGRMSWDYELSCMKADPSGPYVAFSDVKQLLSAAPAAPESAKPGQQAPLEKLTRLTEEMGLYPWQQAQAGEPTDYAALCIELAEQDKAIAKKDAALKACVGAMQHVKSGALSLPRFAEQELDAAITQAQEALK